MGRAPCCEKEGLKKGRWTAEEDEILMRYIQANGEGSWRLLPKNAGLLRCGKSCRLRWINYLRADLKRGNISAEEEDIIIKLRSSFGNKWSLIAGHLPGRTDNEIKNYWNSHLSRRIHSFRSLNNDAMPVVMDIGKLVSGCKRKGGRKNKLAISKNTTNGEMRREKLKEKECPNSILGTLEERENIVLGLVMGSTEEIESGVLGPNQCLENENMGFNGGIESGMMGPIRECGSDVLGPNGVRGSVILGHCEGLEHGCLMSNESGMMGLNEERENGIMDTEEEGKNGVVVIANEERSQSVGESNKWCSSMDTWVEDEWMDMGWSWLWESEGECQGLEMCEKEKLYSAWLLSSDMNVL
ncbi:uncharacterized protein LOC143852965 [Tasmannia lanceolata]|uniref:uncharacterized protein LOC143852965 n=1 Tax=Tasmannia lanceolata TaxID=3420 RepID=UPI00406393E4